MLSTASAKEYICDCMREHEIAQQEEIIRFQESIEELEQWGIRYLLYLLQAKNIFKTSKEIYDLEEIKKTLNILPKYTRVIQSLMEILTRYGYIKEIAEGIYEFIYLGPRDISFLEETYARIMRTYPKTQTNAVFLKEVMSKYFDIVSGKENILNIMFPSGGLGVVEQIYKLNPDAACFNNLAALAVKYYAKMFNSQTGQKLTVIEVGAGVGSTSEKVLPLLEQGDFYSKYMYSDISRTFTRYGERNLGEKYANISFATLDISRSPRAQGFLEHYNIVIATNVLHATKSILNTLKNVKSLLAPGGLLLLNEGVVKKDYSTLVYGLLDGWWAFEDSEWRIEGSPVIKSSTWLTLLSRSGFKNVFSLNQRVAPNIEGFQDIFLGFNED